MPSSNQAGRVQELVSKVASNGLLSASCRFTRSTSAYSSKMTSVEITFTSHSENRAIAIKILAKKLPGIFNFDSLATLKSIALNSQFVLAINNCSVFSQ